jgi:hypothetical protein
MADRLLSFAMNFVMVSLIAGIAGASLALGYWGLLRILSGFPADGAALLTGSMATGIATYFLTRYKNDLVDR